jgi:hypothetical protein
MWKKAPKTTFAKLLFDIKNEVLKIKKLLRK